MEQVSGWVVTLVTVLQELVTLEPTAGLATAQAVLVRRPMLVVHQGVGLGERESLAGGD